jgi:cyclophilin family peptidyl-prolyl cis-trans isomerase
MRTLWLATAASLAIALGGCKSHQTSGDPGSDPAATASGHHSNAPAEIRDPIYVSMTTTRGEIVLALDHLRAPVTVDNFLMHAERGDYDGTIFHRVIPKFVIQGGGFTPHLQERAKIAEAEGHKDPTIINEWTNGLKNTRGTIAMARDSDPDTATREFYINVADNPRLDTARAKTGNAGYAVFGHVVKGMVVVDQIKDGVTGDRPDVIVDGEGMENVPIAPVTIISVRRVEPPRPVEKH